MLGDVALLPLEVLRKRFGFFGEELWLLARGELRETLPLADPAGAVRTCIGSATTLPYDEPDYETALLFLVDQTERTLTTLIRENLKAREMGVYIRFKDLSGAGQSVKFPAPQFEPRTINSQVEEMFWSLTAGQTQPIRQVCINFWNLEPLDFEPDLFGYNKDFTHRELHHALEVIEARYGRRSVKTGTRLLLEQTAAHLLGDKPKCPFIPQREMKLKVDKVPQPMIDFVYEDEWQPLEISRPPAPLPLPRTWGRSTSRAQKFL
jgi:hypothetical protein